METRILKIPKWKVTREQLPDEEKIIYIAKDGKEFEDEYSCKKHDESLFAINEGEKFLTKVDFGDYSEAVIKLLFDGYDISNPLFLKCKYYADIDETIGNYLRAIHRRCYTNTFEKVQEGEEILIACHTSGESGDYPSYYTDFMSLKNVEEHIDNFRTSIIDELWKK